MSGSLTHSPSQIVQQLLVDLSLGTLASANGSWPVTYGQFPDELTGRDNAIFVSDMEGRLDGRSMIDGSMFEFYGINLNVRGTRYGDSHVKARAMAMALDAVTLRSVTISGTTYAVYNFQRTGGVLHLGKEVGTSRHLFSINGQLTVRQSS